ncbi:MAG: hypothetical protein Q8Q09_06170 [Deltaproteobacteria bacterium]|nr:hypothetical protein [Deltaproteobacteria bacterium]
MTAWRNRSLILLMIHTVACGQVVSADGGDASDPVDSRDDDIINPDARDASDAADTRVQRDSADVPAVEGATDAGEVPDVVPMEAGTGCVPPSDPRPAQTLRSCTGPFGAPAEHCREVYSCGGTIPFGSTDAWRTASGLVTEPQRVGCEVGQVGVSPGYLDAYEVSVARFRAWVRAGMPQPPRNARLWIEPTPFWTTQTFDVPNYSCTRERVCTRPDPLQCTYQDLNGANDNYPINCLQGHMMLAFCWWEGKHLASEGLWQAVATNGGRTPLPFSDRLPPGPYDPCDFGDVAECGRITNLPNGIMFAPRGQTASPAAAFGLWGGLREAVFSVGRRFDLCLLNPVQPESFDMFSSVTLVGRSYRDTGAQAAQFNHVATFITGVHFVERDPGMGFRCARAVGEVH